MQKILEIINVHISVLESFPLQVRIVASGNVPTASWSDPRLVPYIYIQPPPDGIYDFDFVADPPEGVAAEVISPIDAIYAWKSFPEGLKGVRIHASQNSKTSLLAMADPDQPDRQPNRFTFSDCDARTRIVFFPKVFMPLGASETPADSQLEYQGAEGQFLFRGDEIGQEQTVLGLIISVILKPNADAGGLDFALILPPVHLGGEAHQNFETVGIKVTSRGRVITPLGVELSYETLTLKGVAEDIPIF